MTATFVPCPRCQLPAEIVSVPNDVLQHSFCVNGHDHALAPVVLRHLLAAAEAVERRSA